MELEKLYISLGVRLDDLVRGFSKAQAQTQNFANGVSQQAKRVQADWASVGLTAGAAAASIGLALRSIIQPAVEFERAMRNVNSIMHESETQFARTSQEVLNISKEFGESAKVTAEGLYNIASSGFEGAAALKVLKASSLSAVAGVSSTNVAAKALTAVLNAYSISADKAGYVNDILFKGVERGVFTFDELAMSIGNTLGNAAAAKIPLEQLVAAFATMTKAVIDAAETSTAINRIIQAFLDPSKEFATALAEIGVASSAAFIQAEGLGKAVEAMNKIAGDNPVILATMGLEMRALRAAMSLTRNEGKDFAEDITAMYQAAGAAQRAFAEQEKAFATQWDKLLATLNEMKITIAGTVLPALTELAQSIAPMVEQITEWAKAHPDLTENILKTAAALGALLAVLASVSAAMFAFSKLSSVVPMLIGLLKVISNVTFALAAFAGGAATAGEAVLFALGGPVGIAIGALALLAGAVIKVTGAYKETMTTVERMRQERAKETGELETLIGQYKELTKQANITKDQKKELQSIMNQIADISPELVAAYDSQGNAIKFVAGWASIAAANLHKMNAEMERNLRGTMKEAELKARLLKQDLAGKVTMLDAWKRGYYDTRRIANPFRKYSPGEIEVAHKQIASMRTELRKAEAEAVAALKALVEFMNPSMGGGGKGGTDDGNRGGGGVGGGGKSGAEKKVNAVAEALKTFEKSLATALKQEALFGKQFDLNAAMAETYRTAIQSLLEAGLKPTDEVITKLANKLKIIEAQMKGAKVSADAYKAAQKGMTEQIVDDAPRIAAAMALAFGGAIPGGMGTAISGGMFFPAALARYAEVQEKAKALHDSFKEDVARTAAITEAATKAVTDYWKEQIEGWEDMGLSFWEQAERIAEAAQFLKDNLPDEYIAGALQTLETSMTNVAKGMMDGYRDSAKSAEEYKKKLLELVAIFETLGVIAKGALEAIQKELDKTDKDIEKSKTKIKSWLEILKERGEQIAQEIQATIVAVFDTIMDNIEDGIYKLFKGEFKLKDFFRQMWEDLLKIAAHFLRILIEKWLLAKLTIEQNPIIMNITAGGGGIMGGGGGLGNLLGGVRFGNVMPYALSGLGGYFLGRAVGGTRGGVAGSIGSMIGFGIGGPIGALAGAVLGGIVGRLFGGGSNRHKRRTYVRPDAPVNARATAPQLPGSTLESTNYRYATNNDARSTSVNIAPGGIVIQTQTATDPRAAREMVDNIEKELARRNRRYGTMAVVT